LIALPIAATPLGEGPSGFSFDASLHHFLDRLAAVINGEFAKLRVRQFPE
jgi:hypothetical protein